MYGSTGHHEPPLCLVDVCADPGPDTVKILHYKVPVLGVERNVDLIINLFIRQKSLKCKNTIHNISHKTFSCKFYFKVSKLICCFFLKVTTTHHSDQVMSHGAQTSVPEHQNPMEDDLINQVDY